MMLISSLLAMLALGFLVDGLAGSNPDAEADDEGDPAPGGGRSLFELAGAGSETGPEGGSGAGPDTHDDGADGAAAASGAEPGAGEDGDGTGPHDAAADPPPSHPAEDGAAAAGEGADGAPCGPPPLLPFEPETYCVVVLAPPGAELDLAVDETAALLLLDGAPLAMLDSSGPFGPGDIRCHDLPEPGG